MSSSLEIRSLGGSGGFGMNALLLTDGSTAALVDYGAGFPHPGLPGIDRLVPDPSPLLARCPRLDAVLLTHGHDDHAAGLPHLPVAWREAPVYGTPLSLALARDRFDDAASAPGELRRVAPGEPVELGRWRVRFVPVTHSLPDSCALVIECPAGRLVHTGDFKLEPHPIIGPPTDFGALDEAARAGVDLLVIDSTGALRAGRSLTERDVASVLADVAAHASGQLFVSLFSSQLHRLESVLSAADACGRRVALLGRRLASVWRHGVDLGLVSGRSSLVRTAEELARLEPGERLWVAAGCQGEPGAALSRLSHGRDPRAEVEPGDTVVVSSSIIPGNELPVTRLLDRMLRRGAHVVHAADREGLHASGHGSREEIREMLDHVRPRAVLPVHGERRHLEAAAELTGPAAPGGAVVAERGECVRLEGGKITTGKAVDLPPIHLDAAGRVVPFDVIRERTRLGRAGVIVVLLSLRAPGPGRPGRWMVDRSAARGLADGHDPRALRSLVEHAANDALPSTPAPASFEEVAERVERRVARAVSGGERHRPAVVVLEQPALRDAE